LQSVVAMMWRWRSVVRYKPL